MDGVVWVVVVLAAASAFGLWRQRSDGRVRAVTTSTAPAASPFAAHGELGERATLVQFSATVCAPCRAAKAVARDVVTLMPGVRHIEINAEHHLELVREFGIMRTPTILVLDGEGRLSARIAGVPRKDELLIALDDRRYENL